MNRLQASNWTKRAKFKLVGVVRILSTYNNTLITATDMIGRVWFSTSAGFCGFRGSRKSTPFARKVIAKSVIERASGKGIRQARVYVAGTGSGRESAIRAIQESRVSVILIRDVSAIAHNGCRSKNTRRVSRIMEMKIANVWNIKEGDGVKIYLASKERDQYRRFFTLGNVIVVNRSHRNSSITVFRNFSGITIYQKFSLSCHFIQKLKVVRRSKARRKMYHLTSRQSLFNVIPPTGTLIRKAKRKEEKVFQKK